MMVKTIQNSVKEIETNFPVNLASRTTALLIKAEGKTCDDYMTAAEVEVAQIAVICAKYDFTNVTDVQFFVSGTWYGQTIQVRAQTDMT